MHWKRSVLKYLVTLLCALILVGCTQEPQVYSQTSYIFGTKVDVSIWGLSEERANQHIAAIFADLDRMHQRLHAWQKSDITALNQAFAGQQEVFIASDLKKWLINARQYEDMSDHLFAPAIGRLIAAWGFHHDTFSPALPDQATIQELVKARPSLNDLEFTATTVRSRNPAVAIDFGGIAKGWALDRAAGYLRKNQVYHALINIGGNILALGSKGKDAWTVGLQDPRAPEAMARFRLNDGEAIGTSGDYQRYFILNNKRYSHLIDPRSGTPAQNVMAATVIAPPSLEAGTVSDVATKPLFIGGVASARQYLQRFNIKDALIITADGNAYLTPGMQARIEWLRKPAHIYRLY